MHPHILPHPEALNPHSKKVDLAKFRKIQWGIGAVFLPFRFSQTAQNQPRSSMKQLVASNSRPGAVLLAWIGEGP
jgi:hypothetical protein